MDILGIIGCSLFEILFDVSCTQTVCSFRIDWFCAEWRLALLMLELCLIEAFWFLGLNEGFWLCVYGCSCFSIVLITSDSFLDCTAEDGWCTPTWWWAMPWKAMLTEYILQRWRRSQGRSLKHRQGENQESRTSKGLNTPVSGNSQTWYAKT